jgi:hypothetical protein
VINVSPGGTTKIFPGKAIMSSEPYADVREMYMAHTMFRREFGLLPAVISNVAAADATRAHHHHQAEDTYLWPRLVSRAAQEAPPIVAAMQAQHEQLDKVLADVTAGLAGWRETADPVQGAQLAATAGRLRGLLAEHLAAEDEQAVPLIAQYITAAEWGEMVAASAVGIEPEQMPLLFGMMMYEGDPEVIREAIDHMPPEVRPVMAELAAGAFARHAELVHGTPAPATSDEI